MKSTIVSLSLAMLAVAAADADVEHSVAWKRNRVSVSFKAAFNIEAEFIDAGSTFALSDPGPATGSAEERTYDNGFNKVDITGNNHGGLIGTWFWDYSDPSQVSGGSVTMQSTSATVSGSTTATDEPYLGFELTYNRELGAKGRIHYGIEGAFGFFNVSITDTDPLPGITATVTDSFSLNGGIPTAPPTGYTFQGPHQVISSTPSRAVTTTAGSGIGGVRNIDANVYGFRLGPYMDIDLGKDWYLTLSGGLAFAAVDSDFGLFESVSLPSGDALRAGSEGGTDWVLGGYVSGSVGYALSENVSIFVGAQYQALGDVQETIGAKEMILHLGGAISGVAGVSVSF